ncbi:MAG: hypothetical protein GX278_04440 [Aeromonadales bacterium]|nr:hypothetical protein [Aeromonadales bacterium]
MEKELIVEKLIAILAKDFKALSTQVNEFSKDYFAQRALLRGLMNMHNANTPLDAEYFSLQDELLQLELKEKRLTDISSLESNLKYPNLYLYKGDITLLKVDAIVNNANESLLGCFQAGHNCTDNRIHSNAGLQLRFECKSVVESLKESVKSGSVITTHGYNLPAEFVIHAVAPKIGFEFSKENRLELVECYKKSLAIARSNGVKTLAFSYICEGQYGLDCNKSAQIAIDTISEDLENNANDIKVILVVTTDSQFNAYKNYLEPHEQKKTDDLHPFFNINLF